MAQIKVGKPDPTGTTVKTILGMNSTAQVYVTEDGQLRWHYVPEQSNVTRTAVSRFELLMSETKTFVRERQRRECLLLLGKALFGALNESDEDGALKRFDSFQSHLDTVATGQARTRFVVVALAVTLLLAGISTVLLHVTSPPHILYFYGAVFGAIGACVSVMQRVTSIEVDWKLSPGGLLLQSAVRIGLGLAFGAVFVMASRADLLLGAVKDLPAALFVVALAAGFSERMIPDLFSRLEGQS